MSLAAFIIVRGGLTQADVAVTEIKNGSKIYMSLISCLGYIADLDIESERFRYLGENRFILGALKSIVQRRAYPCRLSYLPLEEQTEENEEASKTEASSKNEESLKDDESVRDEETKEKQEEAASESQEGENCVEAAGESQVSQGNSSQEHLSCPPTDLLVPLSDPVPSNWKTIEGQFVMMNTVLTPFLSHNVVATTDQYLGSGRMHIIYSNELSRFGMMQFLLTAGSGSYLNREDVLTVKTQAYRLEPLASDGLLVVDGEVIEYGPIQVQLHPHMLRFMSRKRRVQTS